MAAVLLDALPIMVLDGTKPEAETTGRTTRCELRPSWTGCWRNGNWRKASEWSWIILMKSGSGVGNDATSEAAPAHSFWAKTDAASRKETNDDNDWQ
jgi:hypothetical protein